MNVIEDKVRRRLAPFIVEGKIGAPQFSTVAGSPASALKVDVRLKSCKTGPNDVETALRNAMRDLATEAQLVINPA